MLDTADYTPRLRALYDEKIRAAMKEEFAYKNDMQIPRIDKIVLNIGAGKAAVKDSKKAIAARHAFITADIPLIFKHIQNPRAQFRGRRRHH